MKSIKKISILSEDYKYLDLYSVVSKGSFYMGQESAVIRYVYDFEIVEGCLYIKAKLVDYKCLENALITGGFLSKNYIPYRDSIKAAFRNLEKYITEQGDHFTTYSSILKEDCIEGIFNVPFKIIIE